MCSRLGPGCESGATRPKRLALFSVGDAIIIAATVLRPIATVSKEIIGFIVMLGFFLSYMCLTVATNLICKFFTVPFEF